MIRLGDTLAGKYRLTREIGTGGMGVVYQAVHLNLECSVAVKVVHSHLASQEAVLRFMREARVLARLSHPHVTRILDVDSLPDGSPFMVMEFLDGRDLSRELSKRGQLPVAEAVGYVLQVCKGLGAAHERGVIHRDVKPANIFITQLDGERQVKLLDFGIAKLSDGTEGLTATAHSL